MYLDYGGEATWKDAVALALVVAVGACGFYAEAASRDSVPSAAYTASSGGSSGGIVGDYCMIAEDCNGYTSEATFHGSTEVKVLAGTWCRVVGRSGLSKTNVRLNNGRLLWVASEWIQ